MLRWKYFNPKDLPPRKVEVEPTPDRSYNVEEIPWKEESWSLKEDHKSGGITFYEELYRALRHGASIPVSPELVRKVMWIIERCFELCGA